jgi:hypothetical protein
MGAGRRQNDGLLRCCGLKTKPGGTQNHGGEIIKPKLRLDSDFWYRHKVGVFSPSKRAFRSMFTGLVAVLRFENKVGIGRDKAQNTQKLAG